ncbi:MAG TPA: outer membrane beta-barrel protein [Gemmatimonadales bacterium]|nr:outer membrane beta-barrel protein [Gemmatimonadales bacterium]
MKHSRRVWIALGMLAAAPTLVLAQNEAPTWYLEARAGSSVPTFNISDAVDAGPSFGAGVGFRVAPRIWLMGDVDFGFHPGADLAPGISEPDVDVYHFMAKAGVELLRPGTSPWSVVVNLGAGVLNFRPDAAEAKTYPAINAGAKIGYRVSPRITLLLSPQGDIAFTDEDELGTSNAWVWPFTAGARVNF